MKIAATLTNGFLIKEEESGQFKRFYLYKNDLYVAYINEDAFENNIITFDVLGQCEERAFCEPHQIIQEADNRAFEALKEYLGERKVISSKSGWCTKTQYWHNYTLEKNEIESKIICE